MDDEIFRCEDMLDQVRMPELDGVGEEENFGGDIDYVEAAQVVEGIADVEAMAAAEVPRLAGACFIVDDDAPYGRPNGGGYVVEQAVEVVTGGHVGSKGGLAEEVESDFGLLEKFLPEVAGGGGVDAREDG